MSEIKSRLFDGRFLTYLHPYLPPFKRFSLKFILGAGVGVIGVGDM